MGHSTTKEAASLRVKNANTGRKAQAPPGHDAAGDDVAGEARRQLLGAPERVDLPPGKGWIELLDTPADRKLLQAWLIQCVVLRQIDAPRARAVLQMIQEIDAAQRADNPKSQWAGHPLAIALGIETD